MGRIALWMLVGVNAFALACGEGEGPGDAAPAGAGSTAGSGGAAASMANVAGSSGMAGASGTRAGAGGAGTGAAGASGGGAGGAGAAGSSGSGGMGGSGGSAGSVAAGGMGGMGGAGMAGGGSGGAGGTTGAVADIAGGLHELFVHDACTGPYNPQPDTCLHMQRVEKEITIGGQPSTTYAITLRVRGIFEPTTINGGTAPLQDHRYFKVGGTVAATDYSQWHIKVTSPAQTYWLNHYPSTSHTIYLEDFQATITAAGGTKIVVGATDGNDREIDNAEEGLADRRRKIEGVTDEVLDGQMLRLDVVSVAVN